MSCSRWAAAGASMFAFVLSPGAALAAGASRSAARPPSAHARQDAHSQRRPDAFTSRRRRVAARTHAQRHAEELLAPGSGSQQAAGSGRVRVLQRRLAGLGFAPGPIDGRYGPLTTHAVIRFQAARRLRVDGIAGPETLMRLRITAHTAARDRRVQLRPGALRRARSPRPGDIRPGTAPRLPHTAPGQVVPKSLPSRAVATVPASGGLPMFWLLLAGLTAAAGGLVGVAVSRRTRTFPRPRRHISSRTMVIARLAGFRYSRHREAYVLRLVGNRFGPVLKTIPSGIHQPSPRRHSPVHHNRRRFHRQVRS